MNPIFLGVEKKTGRRIHLDREDFRTHMHLIGATGAGKTTAIHAILRPLMKEPGEQCTLFVIDPMGNLSQDLLLFIADERYCPQHVRDRLLYIEPSREDVVLPFNPLIHSSDGQRYYQTMRAVDIVLRAWAAQDVSQQPRLLQWLYKSFKCAAMMGFPISMCRFLLHPHTDEHTALMLRMPGEIRHQWSEILNARGSEATRILESTRNRLDPFFESVCLKQMFGSRNNHFDCEQFIRDKRIVILNVAEYGRMPGFIGDTIGALALNEVIQTCSRLATTEGRSVVDPTYVLMDEFQRFVGADIESALPELRQMGLRLILAHQSFSQLDRDDVDLTQIIWQAQTRLIFKNYAKDADIVADELAKLTFDPMKVKDAIANTKQLIDGYRRELTQSHSSTISNGQSRNNSHVSGSGETQSLSTPHNEKRDPVDSRGKSEQKSHSQGSAETSGESHTTGSSETLVPIHNRFKEISSRTFQSFEEYALEFGKCIRHLGIGEAFLVPPNGAAIKNIQVDYFPIEPTIERLEAVEKLKEANFADSCFISAADAETESEQLRRHLLSGCRTETNSEESSRTHEDPFRG